MPVEQTDRTQRGKQSGLAFASEALQGCWVGSPTQCPARVKVLASSVMQPMVEHLSWRLVAATTESRSRLSVTASMCDQSCVSPDQRAWS